MYCQTLVDERISLASEELGFRLEYHSPADVDEFEKRLEARYADEYAEARAISQGMEEPVKPFRVALHRALANPEKPRLTKEEIRFIQNERALVMCDAAYFLTRYYWILNRENFRQRFFFQSGQKILFDVISEMESMRIAIEILSAKARQLGVTTEIGGLELLKVMISEGCAGIVASADLGKTKEMVSKIFYAYDKLPWWLPPLTSKRVESAAGMIAFTGVDSRLVFQHGKQTNPIAMGSTPIAYHLSEVSSYSDAENLIEVGLFKCVHPSPRVFGILESTCKGDTGWWYDTYWDSKRDWKDGKSRLMALFLPFYCDTDMYPNRTWLRKSPIPENWTPEQETRKMIAESEMYVQSNDLLDRAMRAKQGNPGPWTMPREQAWYWEVNYLEHRGKGAEKTWFQEMPHTDYVAFQGSYDNVFGREVIAEVFTRRQTSYNVYGIVGQSIEERHEPDPEDIDLSEEIVPVKYESRRGETYRWEFWPLKWEEPFMELSDIREDSDDHMGRFFVWLPPEPGYDYSLGVDTSAGMGEDSTVIAVCRHGRTPQEPDVQAAEFRSNQVNHTEAFAWTLPIAAYYARYMEDTTPYREPYVSVEQVAAVGDTVNQQMGRMGYGRFHVPRHYDVKPKKMKKSTVSKRGFFTHAYTRPILTGYFVNVVKNGWYKINSPYTMREMSQWEVHYTSAGKDKYEHSEDWTDDGIFANALASFSKNDNATLAERSVKQFTGDVSGKLPKLDLTVRRGILMNPDGHGVMEDDRWTGRAGRLGH